MANIQKSNPLIYVKMSIWRYIQIYASYQINK